ncbi:GNAT family N-acetyltransferase [Microvirga sp. BT688]|uniref:GNAT family N-acetyltransferase n=1 Tax=Microvirga sp. TaxID=1873136 RepID=UPI00168A0991|nr:GNAT family N-acetyltransferase [Microvirga sp.]
MSGIAISDLRDRPDFAEAVADRVWRAFWKDKGHPLSLLTGLVQENFGQGPVPSCFVAHRGDIFLGTASLIACDEETRPQYTPWIAAVWLEPDHRGRGTGAALIDRAAAFAFKAGAGRVYLLAGPHRRSFYEGSGWSVMETLADGMFVMTRDAEGGPL